MNTKRCSSENTCVHPDGPLLPVDQFFKDKSKRDGYCTQCKACKTKRIRQYQVESRDKVRETQRSYYLRHQAELDEYQHRYRQEHALEFREYNRKNYAKQGAGKALVRWQKRNNRKQQLPHTFTVANWQRALNYWHGACAYCGNPPSLFDVNYVLHQEHHIPQSPDYELDEPNPGYAVGNIVPACQSCNLSKANQRPAVWLARRFGPSKAEAILDRIAKYFEWAKEQS